MFEQHRFVPGQLSHQDAQALNRLVDEVRRQGTVSAAAPLTYATDAGGVRLGIDSAVLGNADPCPCGSSRGGTVVVVAGVCVTQG